MLVAGKMGREDGHGQGVEEQGRGEKQRGAGRTARSRQVQWVSCKRNLNILILLHEFDI